MAEIDGSREFDNTADVVWAVVADPARLADWVPTMRLAQPAGAEEVHLEGESHGHPYSLDSVIGSRSTTAAWTGEPRTTAATAARSGSRSGHRAPRSACTSPFPTAG